MGKGKTIGVAVDFSKSSKEALKWTVENLAEKGDIVYLIHIKTHTLSESRDQLWAKTGSRKFLYYQCNLICYTFIYLLGSKRGSRGGFID